jgi:hypothetical protein
MAITDTILFTIEDVRTVRKVSVNIKDFDLFAKEAQINYLEKILGAKLYNALIADPSEVRFVDLLDGKTYNSGDDINFRGVKLYLDYIWLYLYYNGSTSQITPIGVRLFKDEDAENGYNRKSGIQERDHFLRSADGLEDTILKFLNDNQSDYLEFGESLQEQPASQSNTIFKVVGRSYPVDHPLDGRI